MINKKKIRVLFCCMGNICRSPTAQGVFEGLVRQKHLTDQIEIDSAGTHAFHVGSAPDRRAQATARGRGLDMSHQRARQVTEADFEEFDYVLAMDTENYEILRSIAPPEHAHKLQRMLEFAPEWGKDVPDPYYGGDEGFERVFDMVRDSSEGLLRQIMKDSG